MATHIKIISLMIFACFVCKSISNNIVTLPDAFYYNLTTTSRVDFFVIHHQRQLAANTKALDEKLEDFKKSYNSRLDTIALHGDFLQAKLNELENKLNPLELLEDVNDYCIQKYRSKIPVWATIKTNLGNYIAKANQAYASLVSGAASTLQNLKNYYANQFANGLKDCKKKKETETNYTICFTNVVKTTTAVTSTNTNTFMNQMSSAECSANLKLKETFDCYGIQVFNTLDAIGGINGLVENCINGHEFCPSCSDQLSATEGRCPYQIGWHLGEDDVTSEKITNPFKGVTKSTPCLQINFIRKSALV
ncbi:uncharacterized protein LOC119681791 [Teleopsis dalmanni]|uniref:uncharacterized protein LOC119681791 n=1 Tax=Teleopsis dalmanni TaxID=139649 RepID=UPI0018CDBB2D|nr:uncharacterized protein LOC119681791 [Teleopsis dalmanni]